MREEFISYIKALKLKTFKVSEELPFSNSGTVMYLKNPKSIYVDEDQITTEEFLSVLNGSNIDAQITTVKVYLASDAKQQPTEYQTLVNAMRNAKTVLGSAFFKKEVQVTTEFENDLQVTTFEYTFTNIL
jgi:biopolymer transport protein ExbD